MDGQNVKGLVALTAEERRFIVNCLANVSLQGKAAGLRRVLAMIDGIIAKLEAAGEEDQVTAEQDDKAHRIRDS